MMLSKRGLSYASPKERKIAEERMQEELRQDKLRQLARDEKMAMSLKVEERVEKKHFLRRLNEEDHERQMDDALRKTQQIRILKEQQLEQEERMAKELARINHEKLKDEKLRQQIRENSLELRELEDKLKAAYLNRECAAQVAEKQVLKFEQMKLDSEYHRKMKEELEKAEDEENSKMGKRNQEMVYYQQELETQLEERERMRQEAYQVFLHEKLVIDEIVRKIYEEDQREKQIKLEKMNATKRYIEEFKQQQVAFRKIEREKMEEENQKIIEFANKQQRREQDRLAEVREREQRKLALQSKLAENIQNEQKQRDELELIREELYLEEQNQVERQKQIVEMEKKIRHRLELPQTFQEQMAFKQVVLQAQKAEDKAFMQAMLAKFAEDDRIDQMNGQKRRMKQLEHKRVVEQLLKDHHQQLIADKERELQERQQEEGRDAMRLAIIEEERQKLLKQHAANLLGYLPKGIFKDEEDLNLFDAEFRETFQQRRADLASDEGWIK